VWVGEQLCHHVERWSESWIMGDYDEDISRTSVSAEQRNRNRLTNGSRDFILLYYLSVTHCDNGK
jgi:hypothetical protein